LGSGNIVGDENITPLFDMVVEYGTNYVSNNFQRREQSQLWQMHRVSKIAETQKIVNGI
jgi:hypothetical protein